ncbi:hypothetical protein LMH87_011997 [Akanthomyces muscarius]|uniref:Uncharacterized protein n=2 Tax=Akanthomyces muscarius TaxID=2231603 RepID=A0A9W8QA85_AKAMU|nr:hypothetical protein LMH87_011997 [Akanthomyces muscarius]KAJ4151287.1 hypothetical protein LMH87_011997 [Akanthomyces muscarius]
MENVYFPSMDMHDAPEPNNAGAAPQHSYNGADEQLPSGNYFANSFANESGEWDSILSEFSTDTCIQDPGSFDTSLLSTSPVTSASFRNTPDTVVSNACVSLNGPREGVDNKIVAVEPGIKDTAAEETSPQRTTTLPLDVAANGSHQPAIDSAPNFAAASGQATGMAAGTIVCSAATLGTCPTEPSLVMTTSPRHRVSRLPPDIGADGQIRYLEPHEIPQPSKTLHHTTRTLAGDNVVLPPELEKHMYYPPGQGPSRQHQQIPQQMQMQQKQPQALQLQPLQHTTVPQQLQNPQQFQHFPQLQNRTAPRTIANQQLYSQSTHFTEQNAQHAQHPLHPLHPQLPQLPQHGDFPSCRQNMTSPHHTQQQHHFQDFQQFPNSSTFQPEMYAPRSAPQQQQQLMVPDRSQAHMQTPLVTQEPALELYYTTDESQSNSSRAEKPPRTNSHEWLKNRDFRSIWNLGDVYTNWLDTSPNTVEPHVKPFLKKDIKLGMSSQDATKAAITDGFVRGAGWAIKLFLMQIEKEMRESGTMLGYRPHKKVQKAELERSIIDHIVRTNPPSIHGAQCANVIAWAYDEFYPGVFRQEGSSGAPRYPKEIFDAWQTLREKTSPDQLRPVLFDTSTGLTVMTDIQPSRPPVAQVRAFATQTGQEPAIRIAQFSVPESKYEHIAVNSGESFFTHPEVPATMALQQMKRAESMASRSMNKPQGTRQPPKTAEEKKENRNRKADEKIRWTLTGQSRTIQHEQMTAVSYQCSDGEFRILEGQRLEEAQDRTLKLRRKQQGPRAIPEATGTKAPITATDESHAVVPAGAEDRSHEQAAPFSAYRIQKIQAVAQRGSINENHLANTGEVKRKRVPDDDSVPGGRKRARQEVKHGLRESKTGKEMLFTPSVDISNNS